MLGGVVLGVLDFRSSRDRRFVSFPRGRRAFGSNRGQVDRLPACASVTKQYNLVPAKGGVAQRLAM